MARGRLLGRKQFELFGSVGLAFLPFVGCHCSDGATGSGPSIAPNPSLADICSWPGRTEGIVNGICPKRQDDWDWIVEMTMYQPLTGESEIESCPLSDNSYLADLPNPGWLMRLDKALPAVVDEHSSDHFHTSILATRVDIAAQCSVKLSWTLKQQKVDLPIGTIVRYSQQRTVLDVETDVFFASVLRDEQGTFLIGLAGAIRPEVWYKDMWPELSLSFDASPVCQKPGYPDALELRVTLSGGQDVCTLDGGTGQCCTFSGTNYEVVCPDAWRSASGKHHDYAYILVARQGILVGAP